MSMDWAVLCGKTVDQLCGLLAEREISSLEITEAYLTSIAMQNPLLNAYVQVFEKEALAQAEASDARRRQGCPWSPLEGIPIAVMDNIMMQGKVCACASRMLADFCSPYDATVIRKVKAAGMPILGRLNMDEFAMGNGTETSLYGPARNPWNPARSPGGSSGGPAAAVSAGMAPLALGSDTGGSVRQPAAICGILGVKPAYGTVSRYGLAAFASSLDQIGLLCKTAEDAGLAMNVLAGEDPFDATTDGKLAADFRVQKDAKEDLRGKTLGVPLEYNAPGLWDGSAERAAMRRTLGEAAARCEAAGARVVEVSLPTLRYAPAAYDIISNAEASSNLARFDGVRYGHRAKEYEDLDGLYRTTRREGFGLEVKRRILWGSFLLDREHQEGYYQRALQARDRLLREADGAFARCDALLTPVTLSTAHPLGEKEENSMGRYREDVFTVSASLMGLPALSLPCGLSDGGLPMGMGLMGGRDSLPLLLNLASAYERAYPTALGRRPYQLLAKGGA